MNPETYQFSCGACHTVLSVPLAMAGVRGPCPQCGREIQAPPPPASLVSSDQIRRSAGSEAVMAGSSVDETSPSDARASTSRSASRPPSPEMHRSAVGEPSTVGNKRANPEAYPTAHSARAVRRTDAQPQYRSRVAKPQQEKSAPQSHPTEQKRAIPVARSKPKAVNPAMVVDSPRKSSPIPALAFAAMFVIGAGLTAAVFLLPEKETQTRIVTQNLPSDPVPQNRTRSDQSAKVENDPLLAEKSQELAAVPQESDTVAGSIPAKPRERLPKAPEIVDFLPAEKALHSFLEADSAEKRLKWCLNPEIFGDDVREYFKRHPYPIEVVSVKFQVSDTLEGSGLPFYVFEVSTKQQPRIFPVSVEETPEGYKIDWRLFIEFHDDLLSRYMKISQPKSEQFRVMLERAHYFRGDVPDIGNKFAFRISNTLPNKDAFCFVDKKSLLGEELDRHFKWDHLYMPTVELKWKQDNYGQRWVAIEKIVSDTWRSAQ